MDETTAVQGREITQDDIELVRRMIEANPSRNRTRLSQELCLLLKLEQRGHFTLPRRVALTAIMPGYLRVFWHLTLPKTFFL